MPAGLAAIGVPLVPRVMRRDVGVWGAEERCEPDLWEPWPEDRRCSSPPLPQV